MSNIPMSGVELYYMTIGNQWIDFHAVTDDEAIAMAENLLKTRPWREPTKPYTLKAVCTKQPDNYDWHTPRYVERVYTADGVMSV